MLSRFVRTIPVALSGATITEYAIIGALVLAMAIGAVALLGVNLNNDVFKRLKADFQRQADQPRVVNKRIAARQAKAEAEQSKPSGSQTPAAGSGKWVAVPNADEQGNRTRSRNGNMLETICFEENVCVNVPVVEPPARISSTSGALGGQLTRNFSDVLLQIAQQLANDPNHDPRTLELITRLANQGHSIANQQRDLLSFCQPQKPCRSQSYTALAGQGPENPLSTSELQRYIKRVEDAAVKFDGVHQQLKDYFGSNPNALPPGLQKLIDLESQQILTIANAYLRSGRHQPDRGGQDHRPVGHYHRHADQPVGSGRG